MCGLGLVFALAALCGAPAAAQEGAPPAGELEQPEVVREYTPIPPERLDQMVPKHPGYLGTLSRGLDVIAMRSASAIRRACR